MATLILLFQVCPLCAANLGKDVIGHFMVQHASSFKVLLLILDHGFIICQSIILLINVETLKDLFMLFSTGENLKNPVPGLVVRQ